MTIDQSHPEQSQTCAISLTPVYHFAIIGIVLALVVLQPAPATAQTSGSPDSTAPRIYVPNQRGASISVLGKEGNLITTVDLTEHGFPGHAMPHQVIVAPDGSWYVTLAREGYVAKFDSKNQLVAKTKFEAPGMIDLDPARDRLYVSRALSAVSPPTSLGMFRASDLQKQDEVGIFISRPHALAIDSLSGRVYSASLDGNQIAAFDPTSGEVEVTNVEGVSGGFVGLDTSPDGTRLVATTQQSSELLAFDTSSLALRQVASVSVAPGPYDVRYSPDGQSVWFPNQDANTVTRVDTQRWEIAIVVEHDAFVQPHGVAVTPDSRTVYISSHGMYELDGSPSNGTVTVIDASEGTVRRVTEVGPYAAALGRGWR